MTKSDDTQVAKCYRNLSRVSSLLWSSSAFHQALHFFENALASDFKIIGKNRKYIALLDYFLVLISVFIAVNVFLWYSNTEKTFCMSKRVALSL